MKLPKEAAVGDLRMRRGAPGADLPAKLAPGVRQDWPAGDLRVAASRPSQCATQSNQWLHSQVNGCTAKSVIV